MEEKLRLLIHYRRLFLPSQRVPVFHLLHYHDLTAWRHRFSLVDLLALSTCLLTNNGWSSPLLSEFTNLIPWRCKKKSKNQVTPFQYYYLRGVAPNFLRAVDADMVESERTQKFWVQERLGWESVNFSQRLLRTKHCWKQKGRARSFKRLWFKYCSLYEVKWVGLLTSFY